MPAAGWRRLRFAGVAIDDFRVRMTGIVIAAQLGPRNMALRIGELLLKEQRITPEQLQEALNYQKAHGGKLGFNLVKLGFVRDEDITALLSKQYGVPSINLDAVRHRPGHHQARSRRDRAEVPDHPAQPRRAPR